MTNRISRTGQTITALFRSLVLAGAILAGVQALTAPHSAMAQTPAQPPQPAPAAASGQDTQVLRGRISALRANLDQIENTLKRPNLQEKMLADLRPQLQELQDQAREIGDDARPRVDALEITPATARRA